MTVDVRAWHAALAVEPDLTVVEFAVIDGDLIHVHWRWLRYPDRAFVVRHSEITANLWMMRDNADDDFVHEKLTIAAAPAATLAEILRAMRILALGGFENELYARGVRRALSNLGPSARMPALARRARP